MDNLDIIDQFLISESDNDYLTCLSYQIGGYMNLIRHICQSGGAEGGQYKELLDRYQELYVEKEVVFRSVCEKIAPIYMNGGYYIQLDSNISALIVRKKIDHE